MNAQLAPLETSNAQRPTSNVQLEEETMTARQWSTLLGLTPKALHLRKVDVAGQRLVRGGLTKFFAFSALPNDYREQLEEKRRTFKCLRFADLLDVHNTARAWEPEKHITELPEATQQKAFKVKDVLTVYFDAVAAGMTERDANTKARAMWLQIFGEACNEKTIRRRAARVEAAGGPELARIEAYADSKSVPHHNAQLHVKLEIPADFIAAFKLACLKCGMISAAYREFDIAWKTCQPVPGFGREGKPGANFPLTLEQCRTFAPGRAAMIAHSKGKFAAKVSGALPAMTTRSSDLRRCERFIFDDTRLDIAALDDVTGNVITLKSYWCMEEASRQIVAYTIMKGRNANQVDVDALTARVLRTCGIAAAGAGYRTTLKYERGATACSPSRQRFLEAMFPGLIFDGPGGVGVSRTAMIGGSNAGGDYNQDGSGNFFGKGKIESFMRTLAYFCRHIEGQRGGNYTLQPAALGLAGEDRESGHLAVSHTKGTKADESSILAKAARALAIVENRGTDLSPEARMAAKAFDIKTPLYFESDVREAIALVIAYYNQYWTHHRMEGFQDVPFAKPNGGRGWRKEAPSEKARRLEMELAAIGKAPVRISPADACALMWKAQPVTITPSGVTITIDGQPFKFWSETSIACYEASRLVTLERKYVAIFDREWPQEIYLLRNPASAHPNKPFQLTDQDTAQFLECLPLAEVPQTNDPGAMARGRAQLQVVHNRVAREVAKGIEPMLKERHEQRQTNLQKLIRVVTTTNGDQRDVLPTSGLTKALGEARTRKPSTRAEQQPSAEKDFAAYLASGEAAD